MYILWRFNMWSIQLLVRMTAGYIHHHPFRKTSTAKHIPLPKKCTTTSTALFTASSWKLSVHHMGGLSTRRWTFCANNISCSLPPKFCSSLNCVGYWNGIETWSRWLSSLMSFWHKCVRLVNFSFKLFLASNYLYFVI